MHTRDVQTQGFDEKTCGLGFDENFQNGFGFGFDEIFKSGLGFGFDTFDLKYRLLYSSLIRPVVNS